MSKAYYNCIYFMHFICIIYMTQGWVIIIHHNKCTSIKQFTIIILTTPTIKLQIIKCLFCLSTAFAEYDQMS